MITVMEQIKATISDKDKAPMSLDQIIGEEIRLFRQSETYENMVTAEQYYRNRSEVQNKTVKIRDRSNAKIEHPILKKLIDQKTAYIFSRDWTVDTREDTEVKPYADALNEVFNRRFRKKIKSLGAAAIKSGIAYLQPYFNDEGELAFLKVPSTEIVPLWRDSERTELDAFIRYYDQITYKGLDREVVTHAEYWDDEGVKYFISEPRHTNATNDYKFKPNTEKGVEGEDYHFYINGDPYNWEKPPLVWLRYNEEELPLCYYIKDFIDDINFQTSLTSDLLRDVTSFIYILRNYGGQDLAEFIRALNEYKAIKVTGDGGVDKLQADLDINAVMAHLEKQRRDLYDFGSAVDTKDPNLGNASGTAINFRYMDLDNDCESLASEMQDTFYNLKPFIDLYLLVSGKGDYSDVGFSIIFNSDMPVNESDIISNIRASEGVISHLTLIKQHPWVGDAEEELKQLEKEKQKAMEEYGQGLFGSNRFDEVKPVEDDEE